MKEITTIPVRTESIGILHERATDAETDLIWLLDDRAIVCETTLPALLEHAPGPAASLSVDSLGRPIERLIGRFTETDKMAILEAVGQQCLPLRHIPLTSLLVERDLILDVAPPNPDRFGWYAGTEWTSRLFARKLGMLVPGSRVRIDTCASGSPLHALRAARNSGWPLGETFHELRRAMASRLQ